MDARRISDAWRIPNELWDRIEPLLPRVRRSRKGGRPPVPFRQVLDGIFYVLRTGCQWNHIPSVYGDDSTIHRCFTKWCALGVFEQIWALLVEECDELKGVHWEWQAVDTAMGKARLGGAKSAPTPRTARKTAQNAVS